MKLYRPQELADWCRRASTLLDNDGGERSPESVPRAAKELCAAAEGISLEAAEIDAKCQARNDLLRDIIDSLKEVGFFVADPYFENESQPEGDVVIQARRAGEEVVAKVNLTDEVKSVWSGIEGEHCKTAFHDYVESMASRGANVSPTRADLRERPISIRKGAKDIPRGEEHERGSHQ
ncbi:hypothetical protein [Posidoniimonas polymericola]|uniref:hypothetical protein n=1 Tax=Posidoniimonas polymericola TaxID=2528002 RepID=UPI0011B39DCD|nr:hypothetical protein [Posidoniimonas polymericola]